MLTKILFCLIVLQNFTISFSLFPFGQDLSRGFGREIDWVDFQTGTVDAKKHDLPLFLLIHSHNCPACESLKPRFATNPDIKTLSQYFIMVNCMENEEPPGEDFAPGGKKYYPRILFLTPDGEVVKQLINTHKDTMDGFPYYYYTAEQVVEGMLNAINAFYEFEDDQQQQQPNDL